MAQKGSLDTELAALNKRVKKLEVEAYDAQDAEMQSGSAAATLSEATMAAW